MGLAVWMVFGAGPLGIWCWLAWPRDTRASTSSLPPGYFALAGCVVFSGGATAAMAGLVVLSSVRNGQLDLVAACVMAWELGVVSIVVAIASSRPWARGAVVVTSLLDIVLAVWGAWWLSSVATFGDRATPVVLVLGVTMHALRGVGLLAMVALSRNSAFAVRNPAPSRG